MTNQIHNLKELFAQLGLPNSERDIDRFVTRHHLDQRQKLHEARFLNQAQKDVIRQMWLDDADWSGVIDDLDTRLHQ